MMRAGCSCGCLVAHPGVCMFRYVICQIHISCILHAYNIHTRGLKLFVNRGCVCVCVCVCVRVYECIICTSQCTLIYIKYTYDIMYSMN